MNRQRMGYRLLLAGLVIVGTWQIGQGLYIHAKALLAQELLERAWQKTQKGEPRAAPWPWADTWPVARLRAPEQGADLYVLQGASGNALAFGPGLEIASAAPGAPGTSIIAGHRDTHFGFLRGLVAGSSLELDLPAGATLGYRVAGIQVVDVGRDTLLISREGASELLLVTCYPFDALRPGGPLRYVVRAEPKKVYPL